MIPQVCDIDRLKQGGEHWQWDPNIPFYVGVLPRRGAAEHDVKVSLAWLRILSLNRLLIIPSPSGFEHQMRSLVT